MTATSFPGNIEADDALLPGSISFSDESIRLTIGGEEVGTWSPDDVEIVAADPGFELRAEGEAVRFHPDDIAAFRARCFPGADPDITPTDFSLFEPVTGDSPALDWLVDDEDEEAEEKDTPPIESLIEPDEPDEYFAAGFYGPDGQRPAMPRFAGAEMPPPVTVEEAAPVEPEQSLLPDATAPEISDPVEETDDEILDPEPVTVEEGADDLVDVELIEEVSPVEAGEGMSPASPVEGTALPATPDEPADGTEANGRGLGRRASVGAALDLLKRLRTESDEKPEVSEPVGESDPSLPTPMSGSDRTRQWALMAAGAVVVLGLLGLTAWGVVGMLGQDEATPPPATVAEIAEPEPEPTPVEPVAGPIEAPPDTVSPENAAAAAAFIDAWNELARRYAYHLAISGDSLPLSTAPAPTVHLTYDENGLLSLSTAPKGDRRDRDILVAMGLAVAWADPTLAPAQRKALLSELGIDVDDPVLTDIGGELIRNGVTYRAELRGAILRFEVFRG